MQKEFRAYPFELRAEKDSLELIGHAAFFEVLSEDLGGFREKIRKGAFEKTIQTDDIRALFNHDPNYVLGRNVNGTLELSEDETGLLVKIKPPETQFARDLVKQIARGDISQMSFGFIVNVDEWDTTDKDNPIRTLVDVGLFDVSPVTFAAYPQTDIGVRSVKDVLNDFQNKQKQELELEKISAKSQERKAKLLEIKLDVVKGELK